MSQTQLSEKAGASGSTFESDIGYNPKMSGFDLSRKISTTMSECQIIPLDFFRLLPNDKLDISCRYLLDALPQAVPVQTNYKFIIQLWRCTLSDLWKGAETFITRGRSANIEMSMPTARYDSLYTDDKTLVNQDANGYYLSSPHSLSSYLGLPPLRYSMAQEHTDHTPAYLPYVEDFTPQDDDDPTDPTTHFHALSEEVNALIPFFFQKICRTMMPTNLLQNCKVWFPDDISNDDWRIAPDGSNLSEDGHFVPIGTTLPVSDIVANHVPHAGNDSDLDNAVNIWQSRYVQYGDDLFTTAKPWLVRGDETTLDMDVTNLNMGLYDALDYDATAQMLARCDGVNWATASEEVKNNYTNSVGINFTYTRNTVGGIYNSTMKNLAGTNTIRTDTANSYAEKMPHYDELTNSNKRPGLFIGQPTNDQQYGIGKQPTSYVPQYAVIKGEDVAHALGIQITGSPKVAMTANTLRTLMAFSIKDEIDALTNGNYNSTIRAHFGTTPKHHDFEPRYVGGTVDYINFSKVMQVSESKDDSPLGTVGGIAGSSAGGYLGHIESDDFGYAMIIGMIVPEVTYSDGIEREWTDVSQDDIWFPEYANLGFQPVLNREIKVSGVKATDNDLWGYQTRGIEYKQRRNKVSGLFQLSPDEDMMFSAYNQCRLFENTPELCNEFTTASPMNTRRDYLAFPELPTYKLQFATDCRAVRTLPFKSVPARFGM